MNRTGMNTAKQMAQSLFMMYKHLPEKVRRDFNDLLKKNPSHDRSVSANHTWLKLSDETLSEIWETPENEVWDKYFLKQKKNNNV